MARPGLEAIPRINKERAGPMSSARFKPEVHPRSKYPKGPEQEEQLK